LHLSLTISIGPTGKITAHGKGLAVQYLAPLPNAGEPPAASLGEDRVLCRSQRGFLREKSRVSRTGRARGHSPTSAQGEFISHSNDSEILRAVPHNRIFRRWVAGASQMVSKTSDLNQVSSGRGRYAQLRLLRRQQHSHRDLMTGITHWPDT
jgi:hypothetical protein